MTNRFLRGLSLATCAVSLVGCVTPGGQQQARRPNAADDPSQPCFASLATDKRFDQLASKIAIRIPPAQATLDMLSDKTAPTEDERRLLNAWKVARDTCADAGAGFRAQWAPADYSASLNASFTRLNTLIARLYGGEVTYGEFNRERAGNAARVGQELAIVSQRERDANAAAAAADEDRRRAAVGMALQNMQNQQSIQQQQMLQQQQIQQMNRPRNTNCQRIGNQMNCTTY